MEHSQKHTAVVPSQSTAADGTPRSLWASPAGKYRAAKQLAALLPPHKVYVEPFAGSAAVLFAKPRAPVEVVSDLDAEIADAFKSATQLSDADRQALCELPWVGSSAMFKSLTANEPQSHVERLHRFMYTNHFSFLKRRTSFSPSTVGKRYPIEKRLAQAVPRLAGVKVETGDYEAVVRKYDGDETTFFFDPPYAGTNGGVGEKLFDEARFFEVLKSLRGKFLMTYGTRGSLQALCQSAGFSSHLQFWKRDHTQTTGLSGKPRLPTCLIANFELPAQMAAETCRFQKALPILKSRPEERYILGVVLEPDVVDAHEDICGVADVRKAAHGFMEHSQTVGHMHRWRVDDRVRILESYLLPVDCPYGDIWLRKGTWMLGVRVLDDALWESVQRGELTGFSVGGTAERRPLADGPGGQP